MKRRKGFTFVELLVVMLLLGALSSMAVPRFREYKTRALIAAMQSDLANLKISEEEYFSDHLKYATDTSLLEFRKSFNVSIALTSQDVNGGYTAIATHAIVPGRHCQRAMGPEAAPRESGAVVCLVTSGGSSAIPTP
jgi:prepilin-type N-terminal cleavage/methylation domain-containing protein